jgi:nucleoside-diphosphate-sugar epimerase
VSGRTVLVTGGSGYFGSVLIEQLQGAGDRVRNFDLAPATWHPEGVEYVQGDIRDAAAVRAACDGVDVVFHNVAQQPLARDKELFTSVNVGGTANLLDAARGHGVSKLVFTSSTSVFGIPKSNPVAEDAPLRPVEAYGRTKVEAEQLCRDAAGAGLDVTIIRPRTILGHGRLGLLAMLLEWVADGAPVYVLGGGHNVYQFVHAEDLATACILAAARPGPSVYNVGAADFGTMRETMQALVDHAGTGSKVRSLPIRPAMVGMSLLGRLHLAPFAPYHWMLYGQTFYFDISKAQTELGWEPKWSNTEMMIDSYEWFLANRQGVVGGSHHQKPVRQGLMRLFKRL